MPVGGKASHSITNGQLNLSYTCPSEIINGNACGVTYVVKVPRRIAVEIDGKVGAAT